MSESILKSLRESCLKLPMISPHAIGEYRDKTAVMAEYVTIELSSRKDISLLISNQFEMMTGNHINHALLMYTVFRFNYYEMLAGMIPHVYKAYHSHNFSFDYFPVELQSWKRAMKKNLSESSSAELSKVYEWMIQNHENFMALSSTLFYRSHEAPRELLEKKDKFMLSLVEGDARKSLQLASVFCDSPNNIEDFYVHVIQPSMYDIGNLWENGKLSVAQEHLASSIVGRVMSYIYINRLSAKHSKGRAIVTSAPNEFHEIGAWFVSDLLETNGWQVKYLGANTPKKDLIELSRFYKPDLIAISATMAYNVNYASDVISDLKQSGETENVKIMLGGQVINSFRRLTDLAGADGSAQDAVKAVELAEQWSNLK